MQAGYGVLAALFEECHNLLHRFLDVIEPDQAFQLVERCFDFLFFAFYVKVGFVIFFTLTMMNRFSVSSPRSKSK
jgi:hypothetical protein